MTRSIEFKNEYTTNTKKTPQNYIIFCDPGGDDAMMLAQMLAVHSEEIIAIIASAGNTSTKNTLRNTLSICELAGCTNIKVYAGSEEPSFSKGKPITSAEHVYIPDLGLPDPSLQPAKGNWVDFCLKAIQDSTNSITIISTGSLTDVATLLLKLKASDDFPSSNPWNSAPLNKLSAISIMGGAIDLANHANAPHNEKKPWGEFNILFDPNASRLVFTLCEKHTIPIYLSTTDLTHTTLCGKKEADILRESTDSQLASVIATLVGDVPNCYLSKYGIDAKQPAHDLNASMCVLHPDLYQGQWVSIDITPHGQPNAGQMKVIDSSMKSVFLLSLPPEKLNQFFAFFYSDLQRLNTASIEKEANLLSQ